MEVAADCHVSEVPTWMAEAGSCLLAGYLQHDHLAYNGTIADASVSTSAHGKAGNC